MSEVKTNKISPATGTAFTLGDSGDTFTVPSGANIVNSGTATGFGGGKVLQVVSATKTDTFSHSTTTFTTVTDMTVTTGTLGSTSSKILVTVLANGTNPDGAQTYFQLIRGTTAIAVADADGSRTQASANLYGANTDTSHPIVIQFLDSGSFADTSAVTYSLQMRGHESTDTAYINRSFGDANNANRCRTVSTITAMEIGA